MNKRRNEKLKKQLNIKNEKQNMSNNQSKSNPFKSLDELSKIAHRASKKSGFGSSTRRKPETLMLIVSELSEALEADRKNRHSSASEYFLDYIMGLDDHLFFLEFQKYVKDTYEDEIADAMIRLFDESGASGISLGLHIKSKMRFNSLRGHKHGKEY